MKLKQFRIQGFRSIVDSDWCHTSPDDVTIVLGQNESGKTSILEALMGFSSGEISNDVIRSDGMRPEVSCRFELTEDELRRAIGDFSVSEEFLAAVRNQKYCIGIGVTWRNDDLKDFDSYFCDDWLLQLFQENEKLPEAATVNNPPTTSQPQSATAPVPATEITAAIPEPTAVKRLNKEIFLTGLALIEPDFVEFDDESSLLPNQIDIGDIIAKNSTANGYVGASNFLEISGLDVAWILNAEPRMRQSRIDDANKKITKDFQSFWRQTIGKSNKIRLECSFSRYDEKAGEKAGKPFFEFWITGDNRLFPSQRSKGVRWFISFYLQLKASALKKDKNLIYLLDEPGGSLHAKAQEDILQVIESVRKGSQIILSTHSSYLIKQETTYRLLAVQRADDDEKSPTQVFTSHRLSNASRETLSPWYTAMGIDFSHQGVIQKNNNVILEEVSAFYYLKAFWLLTNEKSTAHFLPATGASNVPQLAYLFVGWGLDFSVVLDDENQGRGVYKDLKKNLFRDDEEKAAKKMMKIKNCKGIEDIFTKTDFFALVLGEPIPADDRANSEIMKSAQRAKLVPAVNFYLAVKAKTIKLEQLEKLTQENISSLVNKITEMTNNPIGYIG
jgi:predicted ATPase